MRCEEVNSYSATIFVAGDYDKALCVCQRYCDEVGLCVTVEPAVYVYTGGSEPGVRIGLINYPRFPSSSAEILSRAKALALMLLHELEQESASVVGSDTTTWFSKRAADLCAS